MLPAFIPTPCADPLLHSELLRLPMTSRFALRQGEDTIVCVSHPGHTRTYAEAQSRIQQFVSESTEVQALRGSAGVAPQIFDAVYAPKLGAICCGYADLLYEEVAAELAIVRALKGGFPLVLTVPSMIENGSLVVADVPGKRIAEYLDSFLEEARKAGKGDVPIWILPTNRGSGTVIGSPSASEDREGARTFSSLQFSPCGELVNPLLSPAVKRVIFAGGYSDGCLLSTITYFFPHGVSKGEREGAAIPDDVSRIVQLIRASQERELLIDTRFTVSQFSPRLDSDQGVILNEHKTPIELPLASAKVLVGILKEMVLGRADPDDGRSRILKHLFQHLGDKTCPNLVHLSGWEEHIIASANGIPRSAIPMLPNFLHPDGVTLGGL